MAKTKVEYIIAVSIISFVSIVVALASVSTQRWIYTEPKSNVNLTIDGYGYYGLFVGVWYLDIYASERDIKIVCIVDENICGWSAEKTSTSQLKDIETLYASSSKNRDLFLNAGLYIVTVSFIVLSLIISSVTFCISVMNIFTNPTNDYIGVYGMKVLNGSGSISYLLTLIIWGVEYSVYISKNIGIKETIEGTISTDGLTSLSYSYWIIFIPMVLHVINIGILYYRDYEIYKIPTAPVVDTDPQKDGILY